MSKPNVEVIKVWVKRLYTTTQPQIQGQLGNCHGGRCCLGVLSDVLFEEFPDLTKGYKLEIRCNAEYPSEQYNIVWGDYSEHVCAELPSQMWTEVVGMYGNENDRLYQSQAYNWNDYEGLSFRKIAHNIAEYFNLDLTEILEEK